jgi:hypothetical protein
VVGLAAHAVAEALASLTGSVAAEGAPSLDEVLGLFEATTIGLERRVVDAARTAGRWTAPFVRILPRPTFVDRGMEEVRASLHRRGVDAAPSAAESQAVAEARVDRLVRAVTMYVVGLLDLDEIVARVDIDRVVNRLDLDDIVAGVDLDAAVSRVDLEKVVGRLDIDGIVARVDVDAIIQRVDLPKVTEQVIDEVDLGQIIRESTGSITGETVDALRYQGMNMDRSLSRMIDRVLMRKPRSDGAGPVPANE